MQTNSNQPSIPFTINTYDPAAAWNGNITFGVTQLNENNNSQVISSTLVVMGTDGQIYYSRHSTEADYWAVKNIAQETLMFQGEPTIF